MSNTLRYASVVGILGAAALAWNAGCSGTTTTNSPTGGDAGNSGDSATPNNGDGSPGANDAGGAFPGEGGAASGFTYTLIDDMETTTHGPIELTGIVPPESPAYWFNFGATAAGDTAQPPYTKFTFSALPSATTTLPGKTSLHAAHELCLLNGQYDVCGIGCEFAQLPELDAGPDAGCVVETDAAVSDSGGDGGLPVCKVTVPFDISKYKGIVFWGKTAADGGTLDIKVEFPDTDTDPRGGVCNSAIAGASSSIDTSQCFNGYAEHVMFTGDWQEFTIMFSDLAIDTSFGYQMPAAWTGTNVYGIEWQGQDNNAPDSGVVLTTDIWVDDVYFIQ